MYINPEESCFLLLNTPVLSSSLNSSTARVKRESDLFIPVKAYASIQNSIHVFGNRVEHSKKDCLEENGAKLVKLPNVELY